MDRDVESKMERLCERYQLADSSVRLARPAAYPSARQCRRVEETVVSVLGQLTEARKPAAAALVRLAYVRGLRTGDPGARLGPDQEIEVSDLEIQLARQLDRAERFALQAFRNHVRHLNTARMLEKFGASSSVVDMVRLGGKPYPLEQHARASVRSVLETAEMAGALAGTHAGSYDGEPNASR